MAAKRKNSETVHVNTVMREIKRLAKPFPLETAQERLDAIAELATESNIATDPIGSRVQLNRETPPSRRSTRTREDS